MRNVSAALMAALVALIVSGSSGTAQSCSDFGSRKAAQQQLERAGDASGALDPDVDGYACEDELATFRTLDRTVPAVAAQDASDQGAVTITADGPGVGEDASGESGNVVSASPGVEAALQGDGIGNTQRSPDQTDAAVGEDASMADQAVAAGNAAATDGELAETAAVGDALAVDTDSAEAAPEPAAEPEPQPAPASAVESAPEPAVAPVVAAAPDAAPEPAPSAPVQLPNTGAGPEDGIGRGAALAALCGLAAVGASLRSRRLRNA